MNLVWTVALLAIACTQPKPVEPIASRQAAPLLLVPASQPLPDTENVHFAPNTSTIQASEHAALDSVARRLRADPALTLRIAGHTDPTETDAANTGDDGLAYARAAAVHRHLLAAGVAKQRLLVDAVGSTEPRGSTKTERGRATNRRVEFKPITIRTDLGGRTVITETDIAIYDTVSFAPGSVQIEPSSFPILDAVAATLRGNPSLRRIEVQSHTDERGDDTENLRLTQARAKVVVAYLIRKGIEPERLDPQGYGETQPLDQRHTEEAWAKNRRIAFLVLERSP